MLQHGNAKMLSSEQLRKSYAEIEKRRKKLSMQQTRTPEEERLHYRLCQELERREHEQNPLLYYSNIILGREADYKKSFEENEEENWEIGLEIIEEKKELHGRRPSSFVRHFAVVDSPSKMVY